MMDKEIVKELENSKKSKQQHDEISNQIDIMLAYGSVNLGLNNINAESYAEQRIKEDLEK